MAAFGSFCLLLALLLAAYNLLAGAVALRLLATGQPTRISPERLADTARRAGIAGFWAVTGAAFALVWSVFTNDFSLTYILEHSNRALPIPYKFAALWSGQEGSLLLWAWLLGTYGFVLRLRHKTDVKLYAYAGTILAGVQVFFLAVLVFAAPPFALLPGYVAGGPVPADGNGLNPLLQYPEMVIHPPMLYLGYVGFSVPFAFALGALMMRYPGEKWIRVTRTWTMVTWIFLTCGIFLGMHWAYAVLGWGGYWGWDPVENASFMPWLTGTAFLHSVMMQERKGMMKSWNVWLIFSTFLLTLLGTLLTRAGLVSSVHAFAQSSIGTWFVVFMGIVIVVCMFAYVSAISNAMDCYLMVWRKFAKFDGRSRRTELWMFTLLNILAMLLLGAVGYLGVTISRPYGLILFVPLVIYVLAQIIPNLAVQVRRFHDTGKSGSTLFLFILLGMIPIVGFITGVIQIVILCKDSDPGVNQYGPNPKSPDKTAGMLLGGGTRTSNVYQSGFLKSEHQLESLVSRESSFLFNNLVLLTACFVILWGTLFPIIHEAWDGTKVTVGAPFYNRVAVPIGLFLLFLTGVGPLLPWRATSFRAIKRNFVLPVAALWATVIACVAAGINPWRGGSFDRGSFYALVAFALAAAVVTAVVSEFLRGAMVIARQTRRNLFAATWLLTRRNTRRYGGYMVHIGVVVIMVGLAGSAFNRNVESEMGLGSNLNIGPYTLVCTGFSQDSNRDYDSSFTMLDVYRDGRKQFQITPERRFYHLADGDQSQTMVTIHSTPEWDLYVVYEGANPSTGQPIIKAFLNPLVGWIWFGLAIIVFGTFVALAPSVSPATAALRVPAAQAVPTEPLLKGGD